MIFSRTQLSVKRGMMGVRVIWVLAVWEGRKEGDGWKEAG